MKLAVLQRLITAQCLQREPLAVRAFATDQDVLEAEGGLLEGQGRLVQWYPGHIARAERRLQEQLSQVDAVLEVRDARCALHAILCPCAEQRRERARLERRSQVDATVNVRDALPADTMLACMSYLSICKLTSNLEQVHVLMALCLHTRCSRPHVNTLCCSAISSMLCVWNCPTKDEWHAGYPCQRVTPR